MNVSSGNGSPGLSRTKGRKTVVVVVVFGGCTHFDTWDWWTAELVGGTNNSCWLWRYGNLRGEGVTNDSKVVRKRSTICSY